MGTATSAVLLFLVAFLGFLNPSQELSPSYQCALCREIVSLSQDKVGKVDPKRTIPVGNARLLSNGEYAQDRVPMIRSEVFLTETVQSTCEEIKDYIQMKKKGPLEEYGLLKPDLMFDAVHGYSSEGRYRPEEWEFVSIVPMDRDDLEFKCTTILENVEDPLVESLMKDGPKSEKTEDAVCKEATSYCQLENRDEL